MVQGIPPEKLAQYRATAQRRQTERQQWQQQRQQQGWQVARQAAQVLKQEFGARRVRLFGSLLDWRRVRTESDIDLAVEGVANERYLEAVTRLLELSDFSVDLVPIESTKSRMAAIVDQHGVEL